LVGKVVHHQLVAVYTLRELTTLWSLLHLHSSFLDTAVVREVCYRRVAILTEEEKKKEEVKEPKVGGPVQNFEDLPEEVKQKLPEEAKQEIKQGLPEKKAEQ